MTIDRQRIAAVTVLTELGYQWTDGKWREPVNTHVGPPLTFRDIQPGAPWPLPPDSGLVEQMLEIIRRQQEEARRPEHEADWLPSHIVPARWDHVGQRQTIMGKVYECVGLHPPHDVYTKIVGESA